MTTVTTWKQDMAFSSELEGQFIEIDGGRDANNNRLGFGPKALLLSGLAGCSGIDVVDILRKMKVSFTKLQITTDAETTETDPKVFTNITITYATDVAPADEARLKRAIELSLNKYCGVAAMLKKNSDINYKIEAIF